jgi:hypothetical protein
MTMIVLHPALSIDLKTIKGRYGDWLDRLELITYSGQNQNFGGKGGSTEFNFTYPGFTFCLASGGFRQYIDHLKFQIIPIPDHVH